MFFWCQKAARGCCDDLHLDGLDHRAGLIAEVGASAGRRQLERCRVAFTVLVRLLLSLGYARLVERRIVIIRSTFVTFQCLYAVGAS